MATSKSPQDLPYLDVSAECCNGGFNLRTLSMIIFSREKIGLKELSVKYCTAPLFLAKYTHEQQKPKQRIAEADYCFCRTRNRKMSKPLSSSSRYFPKLARMIIFFIQFLE